MAAAAAKSPAPVAAATVGTALVGRPSETTSAMAANIATLESERAGTAARMTAVAAGAAMATAAGRIAAGAMIAATGATAAGLMAMEAAAAAKAAATGSRLFRVY